MDKLSHLAFHDIIFKFTLLWFSSLPWPEFFISFHNHLLSFSGFRKLLLEILLSNGWCNRKSTGSLFTSGLFFLFFFLYFNNFLLCISFNIFISFFLLFLTNFINPSLYLLSCVQGLLLISTLHSNIFIVFLNSIL